MIVGASVVKTGGAGNVAAHVASMKDNEEVVWQVGSPATVESMDDVAAAHGRKNSILHLTISPAGPMDKEWWTRACEAALNEYGVDPATHHWCAVMHSKPRASGNDNGTHMHVVASMIAPDGRSLDVSHSFARNEKVARILEVEFGHQITLGAHNRTVASTLRTEGRHDVADAMEAAGLTEADRPAAAFSSAEHQVAKRQGLDLPGLKTALASALVSGADPRAVAEAFGARVFKRESDRHWLVDLGGPKPKALHRFTKMKAADVAAHMEGLKDGLAASDQIGHGANSRPAGQGLGGAVAARFADDGDRRNSNGHRRLGRQGGHDLTDSSRRLSRLINARHRGWRPPEKTARDPDDLMRRVVSGIKDQGWHGPRTQAYLKGLRKADPASWARLTEMRGRGMLAAVIRQPAPRQYLANVRLPRRGGGGGGAPVHQPDARMLPGLSADDMEYAHGPGWAYTPPTPH